MLERTKYVLERYEYGRSITYDVKDVTGNLLGHVKGKRGNKPGYVEFWFTDNTGVQLGHIEGKLLTFHRQYEIKDKDGQLKARIKQKVLQLFGTEWPMEDPMGEQLAKAKGDFFGHNFQILAPDGGVIAKIHREWVSLRASVGDNTYGIEILRQDFDPLLVLGYTIAMDFVQYSGRLLMPP